MCKKQRSLNLVLLLPALVLGSLGLQAKTPWSYDNTICLAKVAIAKFGTVPDAGPEGIYVDTLGHDDNDDIVGNITYNNQAQAAVHIESIYVHGENITTQGRFEINRNIASGEKRQLLVIMRDVKGQKAKVFVDIHFQ
jgi:hypothetical protein